MNYERSCDTEDLSIDSENDIQIENNYFKL